MKHSRLIGVKTTKIYCLPSCPAKAPLPENIVYFQTPRQAERNGFRPCKRCFPDFPYGRWIDRGSSVILTPRPKKSIRAMVAKYVWQWFDLETNLRPFYRMAKNDSVLKHIAKKFFGLRILVIHDLFEALCWAIIGQQINLEFAYTLKQRFVENFGEKFHYDRRIFYLFPTPQTISQQAVGDLKRLQFTGKKSEYIIELAGKFKNNEITKTDLLNDDSLEKAREKLMHLRGIGKWSADYVCLRCLGDPAAFPVDDIGLQNAVKQQLGLNEKPTVDSMLRYAAGCKNWQAYAAFYL